MSQIGQRTKARRGTSEARAASYWPEVRISVGRSVGLSVGWLVSLSVRSVGGVFSEPADLRERHPVQERPQVKRGSTNSGSRPRPAPDAHSGARVVDRFDFFGGRDDANATPRSTQLWSIRSVLRPPALTKTNPFIGLPLKSIGRTPGWASAASPYSGGRRTIRSSPVTPHRHVAVRREAEPPEHPDLGHSAHVAQRRVRPSSQSLIEGHRRHPSRKIGVEFGHRV